MKFLKSFSDFIGVIFVILTLLALIILLCSCSPKASMYNVYLEHQPSEILYSTSSFEDAQKYYDQFKRFHSDMHISTTQQDNNLVIYK